MSVPCAGEEAAARRARRPAARGAGVGEGEGEGAAAVGPQDLERGAGRGAALPSSPTEARRSGPVAAPCRLPGEVRRGWRRGRRGGAGCGELVKASRGTTTVEERRRLRVLTSKVRSRAWPCCGAGLRGVVAVVIRGGERGSWSSTFPAEDGDLLSLCSQGSSAGPKKTPESRGVGAGLLSSVFPSVWLMGRGSLAPLKVASRARTGADDLRRPI